MYKNRLIQFFSQSNRLFGLAICCALIAGFIHHPYLYGAAETVSQIFLSLLKLVSLPLIFLSIVSTSSGMESVGEFKLLGKKVVKYTLLTTVIAAAIALTLFLIIDPVGQEISKSAKVESLPKIETTYLHHLINVIPSNFLKPFNENNVISVLFLAILLSLSIISLPSDNRKTLHQFFSSLYAAIMKITSWIVLAMPLAIWAFLTLFIKDLNDGLEMKQLAYYLACVLLANTIQGLIVLPTFLKAKGIAPIQLAKAMLPALSLAFFSKSSSATLPLAMRCATERAAISKKVTNFSFPLCTTINMNACAAFILITVLFVSMSNGIVYTPFELISWIFIATIAAVGNAGVPMGCFFLSSAFLSTMNIPLNLLGVILPFYSLIDMFETAINVWSDSCVAAVVNKEIENGSEEESKLAVLET